MREHSTRFTEAHFDAKADRYQAALQSCPSARAMETLPFLLFLNTLLDNPPGQLTASDMLCGSGVLTSTLRGCFRCIHGIDVSGQMLRHFPIGPGVDRCKASVDEQSEVLANRIRADVIVALAGLHHVYEVVDGQVDSATSDALQADVIQGWAAALPPGGVMVIADVTDPSVPVDRAQTDFEIRQRYPALNDRYIRTRNAMLEDSGFPSESVPSAPKSLGNYIQSVQSAFTGAHPANPGLWFREVVAKHGLYGHVDHFLNPKNILQSVGNDPAFSALYLEIPTPWVFPCLEAFVYFFYEKFALGPVVDSYEDITTSVREMIYADAKRFLGLTQIPQAGIAVGWRLGFYLFKRQSRP